MISLVYIKRSRVFLNEPLQNNLTILRENCFVQGLIEIEDWLLLIFFICLKNQLNSVIIY